MFTSVTGIKRRRKRKLEPKTSEVNAKITLSVNVLPAVDTHQKSDGVDQNAVLVLSDSDKKSMSDDDDGSLEQHLVCYYCASRFASEARVRQHLRANHDDEVELLWINMKTQETCSMDDEMSVSSKSSR